MIALTTSHDAQLVKAVLATGAMGYLLKDVEPEVLVANIRAVVRGGLAPSPPIAAGRRAADGRKARTGDPDVDRRR